MTVREGQIWDNYSVLLSYFTFLWNHSIQKYKDSSDKRQVTLYW